MLQWLVWLLFSFRGRIPRKWYWLAQAILWAPAIVETLVTYSQALPKQPEPPAPLLTVLNLVLWFPALAVTVKRLNDRGHPVWVAAIWVASFFVPWLSAYLAAYLGLLTDPMTWGRLEWGLFVFTLIVWGWFFIDLGLLRGERGPNRYGPDLLGPADAPATPQPVQWRPTIGETLRDSVTGVAVVIAVLALSGWTFGIPEISHRFFHWLVTPKVLTTMLERGANQPAVKAYKEGQAAVDAGNFEDAVQHYSRAIDLYGPKNAAASWSYHGRAFALQKMDRLQDALSDLDKAIALEPDSGRGYGYRAVLLSRLGRYDDALKNFAAALQHDPNSFGTLDTLMARGDMLEKIGRHEQALADYAQAITVARNQYDKWIEREKEEADKQKLVRGRDRAIARAHVRRGNVFGTMDRPDEALAEYAQALALRSDEGYIYANRGWQYEKQGRLDLARADYEKAAWLMTPDDWLKRALERTRSR